MDSIHALLLNYYLQIKVLHLLAIAVWSFSTAVAYRDYVVPAFKSWRAMPDGPGRRKRRDWAFERFDRGVELEHVAFPLAIITGLLMVWLAGWPWQSLNWLSAKLFIMVLVFLPVEIVDYYLSHLGGNKRKIRARQDSGNYERMLLAHWKFLNITTPLVVVFIPIIFYLAVVKPAIG